MDLKNIETLVDRLTERVEALIEERNQLRHEVERLTAYAAQRDQDCLNLRQEMARAVEAAAEEARDSDRTNAEIVSKLEALNDRMFTLVKQVRSGELVDLVLNDGNDAGNPANAVPDDSENSRSAAIDDHVNEDDDDREPEFGSMIPGLLVEPHVTPEQISLALQGNPVSMGRSDNS